MTPRKMALVLNIPWQNLVHFYCAKFCDSKFRVFLIPPPGRLWGQLCTVCALHAQLVMEPMLVMLLHCARTVWALCGHYKLASRGYRVMNVLIATRFPLIIIQYPPTKGKKGCRWVQMG